MADLEFFFDPVCPWAWITSRWVEEVARQRPMDVSWRFIALRLVNEQRDYDAAFPPNYLDFHTMGLRLLRVAAALGEAAGPEAIGPYYTAVGGAIHVDRRRDDFLEQDTVRTLLKELGHDPSIGDAYLETGWDEAIRADTEAALARTGRDVGTPILSFSPPEGPSFFGPVISRVPRGAQALELWDSVERLARLPGFAELKRSIRERPVIER